MHIYDFLTDQRQRALKADARKISSDRFEDVLDSYRQRFLQSFENAPLNYVTLNTTDEPRLLPETFKGDKDIEKWFQQLHEIIKSEVKTFERLFEDIIDCYFLFIRGRHHTAVLNMFDILEKYDMLNEAWDGQFGLFYRCTSLWSGADENDPSTYYHIPFDLRFLIKNQRFSVSGMPIWYGGASLLSSYYEMRQRELKKHDSLAISFWGFDPLVNRKSTPKKMLRQRTKIYDISNEIYDVINSVFAKYLNTKDPVERQNFFSSHTWFYEQPLKIALRKFVLSNLCTFKTKHENATFHEEYVIPQILTEAIRLHKYDGIVFPSTQFDVDNISFDGQPHTNFFKNNLAMFTEYDYNHRYDIELLGNFSVKVVTIEVIDSIKIEECLGRIDGVSNEVNQFFETAKLTENVELKVRYKHIFEYLNEQIEIYKSLKIDGAPYFETITGKIEVYAISEYLVSLYHQIINTVFKMEFEDWQYEQTSA